MKFDTLVETILESNKQKGVDGKACWDGYRRQGTKKKGGKTVDNCVKVRENSTNDFTPCDHCNHPKKCTQAGRCLGKEIEEASRCTKTTKKASSTSKGKKYMKCVKDGDGYKRIHWGQKGAKVTGKSGNTKRKKSFRARHKCSTAKANTPRGQACKDW